MEIGELFLYIIVFFVVLLLFFRRTNEWAERKRYKLQQQALEREKDRKRIVRICELLEKQNDLLEKINHRLR